MPLVISKKEFTRRSFKFLGGEIPSKSEFRTALNSYIIRMLDHDMEEVNLHQDTEVIYFTTATLDAIIESGSLYLVARFGCEDSDVSYSRLTISLCGMNDRDVQTEHYIGTSSIGHSNLTNDTHEKLNTLDSWLHKERNYIERRQALINKFPLDFRNDFKNGLSHEIHEFSIEWYNQAKIDGMTNVAIYFIIVKGHLSLAYTDARINVNDLRKEYVVYDFGGGCCPPA